MVDNAAIVHHVVIYHAGSTTPSEDVTGFTCSGFGESGWDYLAGWAPGSQPLQLPEGMGIELPANTTLPDIIPSVVSRRNTMSTSLCTDGMLG